ncbi:hypothetical protein Cgig2_029899 [Carnegiea gigantea]|uniref:Cysteine proteinase inhibitor n=1 Tax=Carnegiea gigantea TaxID=171969 RepID=A0A9Q1GGP0_9CARY|nr:hypothetical protein Cgig2_029899 [Carnegiea gigantea]
MVREVGKSIDVASKDGSTYVESRGEIEGSGRNRPGDEVESSEDEESSSDEISESSEAEKESGSDDDDDDSYKESVDDVNPNAPQFAKRMKRFCETNECDELFNYRTEKHSRGPRLCRVGGLNSAGRREMNHGYCKKIAKFAVQKYNEEQNSHLEWIKTVGHNFKTMTGLMHYLTLEAKDEDGSKLYRAQVCDLRGTYILGLFKPAPESKLNKCEACGQTLRCSEEDIEAKIARSKRGAKRKAQHTSDESSEEDNATRKLLHVAGCDEVSGDKGGEDESTPWGALQSGGALLNVITIADSPCLSIRDPAFWPFWIIILANIMSILSGLNAFPTWYRRSYDHGGVLFYQRNLGGLLVLVTLCTAR